MDLTGNLQSSATEPTIKRSSLVAGQMLFRKRRQNGSRFKLPACENHSNGRRAALRTLPDFGRARAAELQPIVSRIRGDTGRVPTRILARATKVRARTARRESRAI